MCNCLQVVLFACVVQAVVGIIVTDPPPTSTEYNYWYDIVDPSTGDAKSLHEIRQGANVRGSYSVVDPDGIKRIVDYVAGKNGFKATVRREPLSHNHLRRYNYGPPVAQNFKSNGYMSPVQYLKRFQTPVFSTNNFIESGEPTYFTPGNDTSSERLNFNQGEYFMPNYLHN